MWAIHAQEAKLIRLRVRPVRLPSVALAAAQWSHQNHAKGSAVSPSEEAGSALPSSASSVTGGCRTAEEIERLAEYSASLYAKTPEEKQSYLEYYRKYYRNESGETSGSSQPSSEVAKNAGKTEMVTVDGVEYKKYRKFQTWKNIQPMLHLFILCFIFSCARCVDVCLWRIFRILLWCSDWPVLWRQVAILL